MWNNSEIPEHIRKIDFDLYGTWEALDCSEWTVFAAGVYLHTLATHSENCFSAFIDIFPIPHPPYTQEMALAGS